MRFIEEGMKFGRIPEDMKTKKSMMFKENHKVWKKNQEVEEKLWGRNRENHDVLGKS